METFLTAISNVSALEWAANITTAICIFLAGRNNVHTWWTGMVACVLFGVLFYDFQLYADSMLQVFFVATSVVGWYGWASKGKEISTPNVTFGPGGLAIAYITATTIAAYCIYTLLLVNFTNAYAPALDSAILVLSIVAQLFMMRRYVLSWPLWVVVNTIAVPLFFSRELYVTSFMYSLYWFHAFYGWYNWNKLSKEQYVQVS